MAFVGPLLALTSNQRMMAKLKQHWKTLHKMVYLIAGLAVLHFIWLVKKEISEPLMYAGIVLLLLSLRLPWLKARLIRWKA